MTFYQHSIRFYLPELSAQLWPPFLSVRGEIEIDYLSFAVA
jgi:hypothetical protein